MNGSPVFILIGVSFQPDGGAKRYQDYLQIVWPTALKYGCKKMVSYVPESFVTGELDADLVYIVRFPSQAKFDAFMSDPEFKNVFPSREDAVRNSFIVQCRRAD